MKDTRVETANEGMTIILSLLKYIAMDVESMKHEILIDLPAWVSCVTLFHRCPRRMQVSIL